MNNQIKSAIILIDNLLNDPQKFSRESLSNRLEEKGLPHTPSAITRLLRFIDDEIGISIKANRSEFIYEIDEAETDPNFVEQYHQYKSLYFRKILYKSNIENGIINQYISFGFVTNNKNIEFIEPLLTAILENRKVSLKYLPFYQNEPSKEVVSPLFIKEYLNRWYLITENLKERHPVFAIDRITDFEILKSKFKITNEITPQIFKNTIGINFSEPIEQIQIWVSERQYPYFETLPFHISQKTEKEVKNGFIISFEVTLNFELRQWLLFFGNSIKVLEPKVLRKQIIEDLKSNLRQYE